MSFSFGSPFRSKSRSLNFGPFNTVIGRGLGVVLLSLGRRVLEGLDDVLSVDGDPSAGLLLPAGRGAHLGSG